jgi:hypothetical protein
MSVRLKKWRGGPVAYNMADSLKSLNAIKISNSASSLSREKLANHGVFTQRSGTVFISIQTLPWASLHEMPCHARHCEGAKATVAISQYLECVAPGENDEIAAHPPGTRNDRQMSELRCQCLFLRLGETWQ